MKQSGPRYDNAMKAMCAAVPSSLCRWLGVSAEDGVELIRLSEMASKPTTRQVDAIVMIGGWLVVHIEFQRAAEAHFGWRMLDYRSLLARRPELAGKVLEQHVVMLGSDRIDQGVHDHQVDYDFHVHYVCEQPVESFLSDPALAPFAVLADVASDQREGIFRRSRDLIAAVEDVHLRSVLAQAAMDLATIRLGSDIIAKTWEDSAMPFPSFRQQCFEEGLEAGQERGREEGREEGREQMVAVILRHRFGSDPRIPAIARRFAHVDPEVFIQRFEGVTSLDELAD